MRNFFNKNHIVRHPPFGNLTFHKAQYILTRQICIFFFNHNKNWTFIPFRVYHPNDCSLNNISMPDGNILKLNGRNPLPSRFHNIFRTIRNLHKPVSIQGGHITCIEIPLFIEYFATIILHISFYYKRPLDL